MVVEVESPKVTEIDQEEAKERKDADKELSKTAWKLVWNRKTPFFATGLLALTFSIRVAVCDYTEAVPEGLDFKWYGEHCGPGHKSDNIPIDELDAACQRHDKAYEQEEKTDAPNVTN
jgi:hypothetical protein